MLFPFCLKVSGILVPDHLVGLIVARKYDVQVAVARQVAQRGRAAHVLHRVVQDHALPAAVVLAVAQHGQVAAVAAQHDVIPAVVVHIAGQHHVIAGVRAVFVAKHAKDLLFKSHVFIPPMLYYTRVFARCTWLFPGFVLKKSGRTQKKSAVARAQKRRAAFERCGAA